MPCLQLTATELATYLSNGWTEVGGPYDDSPTCEAACTDGGSWCLEAPEPPDNNGFVGCYGPLTIQEVIDTYLVNGYTLLGGPYAISDDCPCGTNNFQCYDCDVFNDDVYQYTTGVCTNGDPATPGAPGMHFETCTQISWGYRDDNCFDNCPASSSSSTSGSSSSSEEPTCCPMTSYPGHTVTLTTTLANGTCDFCSNASGVFTLTDVDGTCSWTSDLVNGCSTPTDLTMSYSLQWIGGITGWELQLQDTGIGTMLEWQSGTLTDCTLPATLPCTVCDDGFCSSVADAVIS